VKVNGTLVTYIARFGRGLFNEKSISRLHNRSEESIKMKVQNIASMLDEEGYDFSSDVTKLSGKTTGEKGRRTNWDIVSKLAHLPKMNLKGYVEKYLNKNILQHMLKLKEAKPKGSCSSEVIPSLIRDNVRNAILSA